MFGRVIPTTPKDAYQLASLVCTAGPISLGHSSVPILELYPLNRRQRSEVLMYLLTANNALPTSEIRP